MPLGGLAAAGISALGGIFTNNMSAQYNAEEAQKNRDFQERMYNKQYQDSIDFWRMEQEYNTPANQLDRLTRAGLNPLLAYGNSGLSGNIASQSPDLPSQPSGSQASASFVNPMETAQYLLIDAEREKKKAETDKIKSETDWQSIENRFNKETFEIRKAIQYGNWDLLKTNMDKMRAEIYNSGRLTTQQELSMMQARQYEIKRFNLDEYQIGESLLQGWKHLANESSQAAAALKNAAAALLSAQTQANISKWQIGAIAQDIFYRSQMQHRLLQSADLDNLLKKWDTHLKKASANQHQVQTFNQALRNYYLRRYGNEQTEGRLG